MTSDHDRSDPADEGPGGREGREGRGVTGSNGGNEEHEGLSGPGGTEQGRSPEEPTLPEPAQRLSDSDIADRFADIVARWESTSPPGRARAVPPAVDAPPSPPSPPISRIPRHEGDSPTGIPGADDDRSAADAGDDHPSRPFVDHTPEGPHAPEASETPDVPQTPAVGSPQRQNPQDVFSGVNPPLGGSGWRVHTPPPEPEEDFVPPPPRPLPQDPGFWAALFGLVAGPLWLLWLTMIHRPGARLHIALSIALTVAGFAILVARLPRRGQRDDNDDGAVV